MIQLEHVSRTFREKNMEVRALQDVSLHVREGEIFGIVGFSGAGKSTLIRLVNRLETPDGGTVRVKGQDLAALTGRELTNLRRKIGMVFQQFNLLEGKTVFHNIAIPLRMEGRSRKRLSGGFRKYWILSNWVKRRTPTSASFPAARNSVSASREPWRRRRRSCCATRRRAPWTRRPRSPF